MAEDLLTGRGEPSKTQQQEPHPDGSLKHHGAVDISEADPIDVRPLLPAERARLLSLLTGLDPAEWQQSTGVPGWSVKDLALHLLDGELGVLSRQRDGEGVGIVTAPNHQAFVEALAAKNQRWIDGAQPLSPRVIADLLDWSGQQIDTYYSTVSWQASGHVSWASNEPVPIWLDIAREFTERWVHQMQIREAIGRVDDYASIYLPTVLRTFVWAIPHQYRVVADRDATVQIDLGSGGVWHLVCDGQQTWSLNDGPGDAPSAIASFSDDGAWRWLTGSVSSHDDVVLEGSPELCQPLLRIRAVIV